MPVSLDQLDDFHRFAQQRVQAEGAESLEELCDLWRIEHPSTEEQAEIHEAIRQGLADIAAGRHRPVREVMEELRAKHGLPPS
jgi:predicted transcriptional regulator